MKKIKLLPSIIMLALCLCVLGIGVYSATTGSNTITGTLTVNSAGYEVEIAVYNGTDSTHGSLIGPNMYGTQIGATTTSRAGADITLSDLEFNSDEANTLEDVDMIDIIIAVTNKSSTDVGIYFWNKGEATTAPTQAAIETTEEWAGEDYYDVTIDSTDVLFGHQNLSGVDADTGLVAYNNIADAEYSFYHHLPGYYTLGSGTDANFAYGKYTDSNGKRYYTEYLHVLLTLKEFVSEDVEIGLNINLCVEEYEATATTISAVESASGFTKIAKGVVPTSYSSDSTFVVLPYGLSSVIEEAFSYHGKLVAASIPTGVITIGAGAFNNCRSVTSIILPSSLTSLSTGVFYQCYFISIMLPAGLSQIGNECFTEPCGLINAYFSADNASWWVAATSDGARTAVSQDLSNPATAATCLKTTYVNYYWFNSAS